METYRPKKIVSGGQTGADRAGLDVAIRLGMSHGGWCPAGRRAEGGQIPACYQLTETQSASYVSRTNRNIRDSDATVVFTFEEELSGGSKRTALVALGKKKP
jgi:predicted Rossmann-fold nucleotide-binding protein